MELLLAGAIYFGIRAWQTRHILDGPAPPVAGVTLDGSSVSLESLRGQPVLLYFWATWCGACKMQQPNIDTIAKDAAIITVAAQSGDAVAVREELKTRGLNWPVLNDPDGTLAAAYGVHAYPTVFFISPDGNISTVEVGYTTTPGLRLRLWWAGL